MMPMDDVDVLIMAAGSGRRYGGSVPKQWLSFGNAPLFLYTAQRLRSFGASKITLVVQEADVERTQRLLEHVTDAFVYRVVSGGGERQESVWAGLCTLDRPFVAVHDAARPLIQARDLHAVVQAARTTGAATLGHPARDSLLRVDEAGQIVDVVARTSVWQVQTPQVARLAWLLEAHKRARMAERVATDDTALLREAGYPVAVVRGSAWNMKVTEAEDARFVRSLLDESEV